jgi:hypothetical protein
MSLTFTDFLRFFAMVSSFLFIYIAVFLYEDEQGKVQSILEDWWIKIEDVKRGALSRHTIFMSGVAQIADSVLNRIFGKKLFSLQSLSVSACLSIASLGLAEIYLELRADDKVNQLHVRWFALWFLCFLLVSLIPFLRPRLSALILLVAILSGYLYYELAYEFNPESEFLPDQTTHYVSYCLGMIIGVVSDVLFIAVTRKLLRRMYKLDNLLNIVGLLLVNCFLAYVLVGGMWHLANVFTRAILTSGLDHMWYYYAQDTLSFAALFNVITVAVASIFIFLILLMLLHRIFWPLLNRPIYALAGLGIVRRRKLFGAIGLLLLGLSIGYTPSSLKEIIEKLIPS